MNDFYETKCTNCNVVFVRHKYDNPQYKYQSSLKRNNVTWKCTGREFCSVKCKNEYQTKIGNIIKPCGWCSKEVTKYVAEYKSSKSGEIFCNRSCSASFNNTKKRKATRSKSETLLFNLLKEEFNYLNVIPNDKELLDGYEVDIAIPSIKLAIEWNGIVHFKPIYGCNKFTSIQKRDFEKQQKAIEKNINLIVIPDLVSTDTYVKESFQTIKKIILNMIEQCGIA